MKLPKANGSEKLALASIFNPKYFKISNGSQANGDKVKVYNISFSFLLGIIFFCSMYFVILVTNR